MKMKVATKMKTSMEMKDTVFQQARINRNQRYDGVFYFAVLTTGIFCRPSCPSPTAKEENVRYFSDYYEAMKQGFRACKRCYPDVYTEYQTDNIQGEKKAKEAVNLILSGYLNQHSVSKLAKHLKLSERYLRQLLKTQMGLSPVKLNNYHRMIFAKKLLMDSDLSVTRIALASGFGSIRQFNAVFKELMFESPSAFRKEIESIHTEMDSINTIKNTAKNATRGRVCLVLHGLTKARFQERYEALKAQQILGIESFFNGEYKRYFRIGKEEGYFVVRAVLHKKKTKKERVELVIYQDDMKLYMAVYYHVKKLFYF